MKIFYSDNFERRYGRLPGSVREKAKRNERIFRGDPFDPRLRTHKLKGKLSGLWAFWIDWRFRIIFEFIDKDTAYFESIGSHTIYH
jgi:mRNA-degrading endonuclease YafQ of YafQ-DinJ toxin-antitoxin module